jgi:hypothetical protein
MILPKMNTFLVTLLLAGSSVVATAEGPSKNVISKNKFFASPSFVDVKGGASTQKLGSDDQSTETLEISIPLSQAASLSKNRDGPLMKDISMLQNILSDLIKQEDPVVHVLWEEFMAMGKQR